MTDEKPGMDAETAVDEPAAGEVTNFRRFATAVCVVGVLVQLLLTAYSMGVFPMAQDDGRILWYDPNPRAVIPIQGFHRPKRLMRTLRNAGFELRVDTCFRSVMEECAAPRPDHQGTWISEDLIDAYVELHRQGRFPFDRLVRFYDLADIDAALEASSRGDVLKPVLRMPH